MEPLTKESSRRLGFIAEQKTIVDVVFLALSSLSHSITWEFSKLVQHE